MLADIMNEQAKSDDVGLFVINNLLDEALLGRISSRVAISRIGRRPGSISIIPLFILNRELSRFKPDIIHCHDDNAIRLIRPGLRRKAVLTVHRVGAPPTNLTKFKRLYAISHSVEDDVRLRARLMSSVVYNGIRVGDVISKKHLDKPDHQFSVVQVGRLDHRVKGQHTAIEAIKILKERFNIEGLKLDFIGEGPSEGYLRDFVKRNDLEKEVGFLGLRDRKYIYSHLRDYELVIQPSSEEAFGLTVVEAMAAKIPVLVSNVDGPGEITKHGKIAYMFEKDNPKDLAAKIALVFDTYGSEEMAEKIDEAFESVKNEYDILKTAQAYLSEYTKLVSDSRRIGT